MGQAAGGVAQAGSGVPAGYQPENSQQIVASRGLHDDNGHWNSPHVSQANAGSSNPHNASRASQEDVANFHPHDPMKAIYSSQASASSSYQHESLRSSPPMQGNGSSSNPHDPMKGMYSSQASAASSHPHDAWMSQNRPPVAANRLASFTTDCDAGRAQSDAGSCRNYRAGSFSTDVDAAEQSMGFRGRASADNGIGGSAAYYSAGQGGVNNSSAFSSASAPLGVTGGVPYPAPSVDSFNHGCDASSVTSRHTMGDRGDISGAYQSRSSEHGESAYSTHMQSFSGSIRGGGCFDGDDAVPGSSRDTWDVGSVVEVYSATVGQWFPARVMHVLSAAESSEGQEVLTVQFSGEDGSKMKSTHRSDPMLAPFGAHLGGELPPGFEKRASQSRPGHLVFFDATSGMKYGSVELAWRVHLERLLQQPQPAGLQTICNVPSRGAARAGGVPPSTGGAPAPPVDTQPYAAAPTMETSSSTPGPANAYAPMFSTERPQAKSHDPVAAVASGGVEGKIALPSFGDARQTSQSAYLGFYGSSGFVSVDPKAALPEESGHYPAPSARVPPAQRPPVRPANPAHQAWQDDPFSEWRR